MIFEEFEIEIEERRKTTHSKFNPKREEIMKAIDDFMKNGGRIKTIPAQIYKHTSREYVSPHIL